MDIESFSGDLNLIGSDPEILKLFPLLILRKNQQVEAILLLKSMIRYLTPSKVTKPLKNMFLQRSQNVWEVLGLLPISMSQEPVSSNLNQFPSKPSHIEAQWLWDNFLTIVPWGDTCWHTKTPRVFQASPNLPFGAILWQGQLLTQNWSNDVHLIMTIITRKFILVRYSFLLILL